MKRDVLVCQGCGFLLKWNITYERSTCPHCNRSLHDARAKTIDLDAIANEAVEKAAKDEE